MNFKLLMIAVLVLIGTNICNLQKAVSQELDPNILWVADSSIGRIDGFAVHPNGNIFAYNDGFIDGGRVTEELKVFEIDGKTGKLLRILPKIKELAEYEQIASIDISNDGRYIALSYVNVIILDLNDLSVKIIGKGNPVIFTPDSKKLAYGLRTSSKPFEGSIINIFDIESNENIKVQMDEMLSNFAFSPNGRFLATGGVLRPGTGEISITLKLWDANTLQFIRELDNIKDHSSVSKVQFSDNSRMVAFFGSNGIQIFDTDSYDEIKHYTDQNLNIDIDDWITDFTFITNEYIGIQSEKTSIIRLSDDHIKNLFDFEVRGFIDINKTKDILFSGTGYPKPFGPIRAWDLNKVFSGVENEPKSQQILAEYINGILKVRNLVSIAVTSNMKILDIQGKVIKEIAAISAQGNSIEYRIKLQTGVYILLVSDGSRVYSEKFLVVE